ncbi:16S rRNA (guanine(527)-N(7))-methyltransferase RsmG [Mycoplasmopsis hyopharyngis]|uniref:16S rRNA (guanine(527)-N(7))-methyltransferase RsmG n=1 Tax=Mycoplasmopsis hyopharyngis TaxID=29558 RepID=UPI003872F39F
MKSSKQIIKDYCQEQNLNFSLIEEYVQLLLEKNKVINLIGFNEEELWKEGILSSLQCLIEINKYKEIDNKTKILDIGAGSGLPSIPYMLLFPNINLTIYEPIRKRFDFLVEIKNHFKLTNLTIKCLRAEEAKEDTANFDLITARAVSELKNLIFASYHLLKTNGSFVFIKGKNYNEEVLNAQKKVTDISINFKIQKVAKIEENDTYDNYLVICKKQDKTPNNWPLTWNQILKK